MKIKILVPGVLALLLCGCLSPNVEVTVAPEVEKHFGICPSLEVDIAAVGGDEARRAGNADVDFYFEPDSPMRTSLRPETLTFSQYTLRTRTLSGSADCWDRWAEKSPDELILYVNLPIRGDLKADGRRISVKYDKSFLFRKTLHFRITPSGLIRSEK